MALRQWLARIGRLTLLPSDVLTINCRNVQFGLDVNSPSAIARADDKQQTCKLCVSHGIPTPRLFAVLESYQDLDRLSDRLARVPEFVVKPNRGRGGQGVVLIVARHGTSFLRHNGERWTKDDLLVHISDILSGQFSFDGQPDIALIQQRVRLHPGWSSLAVEGIPDVRFIVYRGELVMAMLRLPTKASRGCANLHQGGIGAGIDLATGRLTHAIWQERPITRHPDHGILLRGQTVPFWNEMRYWALAAAQCSGLGYVGVDMTLDAAEGPVLLEWNARPGLAIQLANRAGLLSRLREKDQRCLSRV
jgi:alpha-L-glutamate ligase-like protein